MHRLRCIPYVSKQDMNPRSASALVGAAAIVTFMGLIAMSPAGQLFFCIVGAVFAVVPTIFGPKGPRVAGGVMLAIAIALAYQGYPAFEKEKDDYRKRVEARSAKVPAQSPVQEPGKK
jgi:membrane protein implicated in regulation of membrane protease activity